MGLARPSLGLGHRQLEMESTLPPWEWDEARCHSDAAVAKYLEISKVMPTRSILELVRKPTIDMWQWEDYEVSIALDNDVGLRRTRLID